ncbi:hypothetical protein IG631_17091 [Alternaria alternata]|nr:hypothetical protein IG631_17091 [Alternaria alternata]
MVPALIVATHIYGVRQSLDFTKLTNMGIEATTYSRRAYSKWLWGLSVRLQRDNYRNFDHRSDQLGARTSNLLSMVFNAGYHVQYDLSVQDLVNHILYKEGQHLTQQQPGQPGWPELVVARR